MASFTLEIQVGSVTRILTVIETAMEDPTELMQDVLLVMIRSTQLNFEAQGRPVRWTGLAPATIARRLSRNAAGRSAKKGVAGKKFGAAAVKAQNKYFAAVGAIQILRDFGLLFQSVGGNANGAFSVADGFGISDKFTAQIGTNRPGADALQLGNPTGNLDPRPYILFQDQDEEDIADMSVQWLMRSGPYAVA